MAKWRFQEHMYHDPLRAEFANASEFLTPEETSRRYREAALQRMQTLIAAVLEPRFPDCDQTLISAARAEILALRKPIFNPKKTLPVAAAIVERWRRVITMTDEDAKQLNEIVGDRLAWRQRSRRDKQIPGGKGRRHGKP
jgi:hypothetical protein